VERNPASKREGGGDESSAEPAPTTVALVTPEVRKHEPQNKADSEATIRVRLPSAPRHLNPLLAGDTVAVGITLGDVYETLLQAPSPSQSPQALLAESFSHSADGRRWRFRLRKQVAFHDGTILSVKDVVSSVQLAQRVAGPLRGEFDDVVSIVDMGNREVEFKFLDSRPARAEAFAALPIVSSHSFADVDVAKIQIAVASQQPNGTGALRFSRKTQNGYELERFPGYWGPPAKARRILYRVIPERSRAVQELQSGSLDVCMGIPIDEAIEDVQGHSGLTLVRRSVPAYIAAVFNTGTLNRESRKALSRSFDRESLVRELFRGFADIAVGPYVPKSLRSDPEIRAPVFSLASTKKELSAVWGDSTPTLQLLVPVGSRTMERLADIWASDLRGLVTVNVQRPSFGDMLARVRAGDFDVALLSFTKSSDIEMFSLFHSSEVGRGNLSRLARPEVDQVLEALRHSDSLELWIRQSRQLQGLLVSLAPVAFLTTDSRLGIVRSEVAGIGDSSPGTGARFYWRGLKSAARHP